VEFAAEVPGCPTNNLPTHKIYIHYQKQLNHCRQIQGEFCQALQDENSHPTKYKALRKCYPKRILSVVIFLKQAGSSARGIIKMIKGFYQ
jgi:hypothetical protein